MAGSTEGLAVNPPEFIAFPKMARLNREVVVTEKIDGTNAQIHITDYGDFFVGSRTRWITPQSDNFGFAGWCERNKEELMKLGPGSHFGEWWGSGIQRGYNIKEKRFSLFNTARWSDDTVRPACCFVVPVLWHGMMENLQIHTLLTDLEIFGSKAAPGFMNPEGVVIYHTAANVGFKRTIKGDESPKGLKESV